MENISKLVTIQDYNLEFHMMSVFNIVERDLIVV